MKDLGARSLSQHCLILSLVDTIAVSVRLCLSHQSLSEELGCQYGNPERHR